jgi:CDGSH-type Zn-finger protein
MAKKKAPAKKAGRNEIDIDWKQAAYLCECGALGTEVAASLGVHERTLYTRCT